jgi:CRP/FNR family transcriptional regulator
MKNTHVTSAPQVGTAQHTAVSYLPGAAQRVAVNPAVARMQQALAQVEDLKRSLASSEQEAAAARKEIEILTRANAQISGLALQRDIRRGVASCPAWEVADLSLAEGLDLDDISHIKRLLATRIRFRNGDVLYRCGDGFDALYAIRTGSCKTALLARDGTDHVTGYHIGGEIIGMDGIASNIHQCQATALESTEVWLLPFDRIDNFARFSDQFRHNLHKLLSQECSRAQTLMLLLGTMRAEKRLAVYLVDLSQRYRARGFSPCELVLRMTRAEIGSYLGLKLETVCRQFSRFQREGLIQVEGRVVKLLDRVALSRLADCSI